MDKVKNYSIRCAVLILGLLLTAIGTGLSAKADLGIAPISCIPYVISLKATVTMGQATIIMHVFFILMQIALLRRNYDPLQLFQLAAAFIFGYFTDFGLWIVSGIEVDGYISKWLLCILSFAVTAFGIFLEVKADVITLAGEGLTLAVSQVSGIEFGKVKVGFDCILVIIGIAISFCMYGRLQGIREGTIASAIVVGMIVRLITKLEKYICERINRNKEGGSQI